MSQSAKIAISLPSDLMHRVEQLRQETGETRSAFIRRMLELAFQQRERDRQIRAYVDGYQKQPEGDDEITEAESNALILGQEPW